MTLLPVNDRDRTIESIEKGKLDGSLDMIEGGDKFELVKEGDEWRIFLNWAAGIKIPLRLELAHAADLEALSKSEAVVQPGELFELTLKTKNRSKQPLPSASAILSSRKRSLIISISSNAGSSYH